MQMSLSKVWSRSLRDVRRTRFSTLSCLKQTGGIIQDSAANRPGTHEGHIEVGPQDVKTSKSPLFPKIIYVKRDFKGSVPGQSRIAKDNPLGFRDACSCQLCVDPSTKQKSFQTSDVPLNIAVSSEKVLPDGTLEVTWLNDVPGFGEHHVSTYSREFLDKYKHPWKKFSPKPMVLWDKSVMSKSIKFVDFDKYISSDSGLFDVLKQLHNFGLVFIRGVPDSGTAVEDIGCRIGHLKETFYGRTWDVKSVPQAKNVAYTHQFLGFHMDLLYTDNPPGLQLLHCLRNSCEGGSSLFSDSYLAATNLRKENPALYDVLRTEKTTFQYHNAGEHYRARRPTIVGSHQSISQVNWSPPFQGPFVASSRIPNETSVEKFQSHVEAMKAFAAHVEAPENIYEYRMQEGECVIFNNRRVLHSRRAFDVSSGERWLKGAYLDRDVFMSRFIGLRDTYGAPGTSMPPAEDEMD